MDGFKRHITRSIQTRLVFSLVVALCLMAIVAAIATYKIAKNEAKELQDATIKEVMVLASSSKTPLTYASLHHESSLIITAYTLQPDNRWTSTSMKSLIFDITKSDGLHNIQIGGNSYRVLIKSISPTYKLVVAQSTKLRDDTATSSAIVSIVPIALFLPLVMVLIYWSVNSALKPVKRLSSKITEGAFDDLSQLDETSIPDEVRPFIQEMNRLFHRVSQTMDIQRRFVADAAHELRTPLMALSLQVEQLSIKSHSSIETAEIEDFKTGIDRCNHMVNQLLALAKVQSIIKLPLETILVKALLISVIEELMPLVEANNIDLGINVPEDLVVNCHLPDAKTVVRNILGNAIKYTPFGGLIEISSSHEDMFVEIIIEDSGPGIDTAELEKVFEPFYRGVSNQQLGVGLGLSIVNCALRRLEGSISLTKSELFKTGLKVKISIPSNVDAQTCAMSQFTLIPHSD